MESNIVLFAPLANFQAANGTSPQLSDYLATTTFDLAVHYSQEVSTE
jgi:hypothetical protein